MKRSRPPQRSTKPIRARKQEPAKRRWAKHRCQPHLDWLKNQPCCITGKMTGDWWLREFGTGDWHHIVVDPAHLRERSLGGDDLYNALPLAHHLHDEQHAIRWPAFAKKYGIDPVAIAREHTDRWLATDEGQAWAAAGKLSAIVVEGLMGFPVGWTALDASRPEGGPTP